MDRAQDDLEMLERCLHEGSGTQEAAQRYHAAALARGQLDRARRLFDLLRKKHTDNLQMAGFYIAICLQQGDDPAAMTAIEALAASATPPDGLLDAGLAVRRRLGPMVPDPAAVSLSLCMIARNEAPMLGPCLFGIKSLVHEIILIDTGSQDRTADIGQLFGAKVHAFAWCDDFAAARNFALSKASGQWVLVLDADETIAPQDFGAIRRLIGQYADGRTALAIETRNYCHRANTIGLHPNEKQYPTLEAGVGWFPSTKVRLFRRDPRIRFHFPVHERVEPSLDAAGIRVLSCPVPVHHYGHLNETRNQEKALKYYELGYAKLADLQNDPGALRELAVQAGQLEHWKESIELWQRLLAIRPHYAEALVNLSGAYWQLGQYDQALIWGQTAVELNPGSKEAWYNIGLSLLMLGRAPEAVATLKALRSKHKDYLAADFMLAVSLGCIDKTQECRTILDALGRTPIGPALGMALKDLIRRMRDNRLDTYSGVLEGVSASL